MHVAFTEGDCLSLKNELFYRRIKTFQWRQPKLQKKSFMGNLKMTPTSCSRQSSAKRFMV